MPIFSPEPNGNAVHGSTVGTRRDLRASPDCAADGSVRARIRRDRLANIDDVLAKPREGRSTNASCRPPASAS
ncbi:hypothetical protein WS95_10135 [Burkholderia sp. MSMB1826]|nr:hypothetical protein WS95_10135 [Burkholderia sp. MSMB1826]